MEFLTRYSSFFMVAFWSVYVFSAANLICYACARGLVTRRLLCAALCSDAETGPGGFHWVGGWA